MSLLRSPAFRHYGIGLVSVVAGAGLTSATGSMLPLAMGSALALMNTVALVRAIRARAAARRVPRPPGPTG
jgi:hypothetical protein